MMGCQGSPRAAMLPALVRPDFPGRLSLARARSTVPTSTFSPDEACLPSARSRVTVSVLNSCGETPAHRVTLRPSLNVPTGTSAPARFLNHAS